MKTISLIAPLASEESISMNRYVTELAHNLDMAGIFRVSFTQLPESEYRNTASPFGKLSRYRRRYLQYPKFLQQHSADLFHIVDQSYSYLLPSLPSRPSIVTCHDVSLLTERQWAPSAKLRPRHLLSQWSLSKLHLATKVIAVSQATKSDLVRMQLANEDAIVVVPSGLAPIFNQTMRSERLQTRQSKDISDSAFVVFHVGQDSNYKNLFGVLNTAAALVRQNPRFLLVRAGKPLSSSNAGLLDSLGLRGNFVDLGEISDFELARWYGASDCLLFPSLREGFGWPVVESMACGTPVVTSRDRALLELNPMPQLSAEAQDHRSLAGCVLALYSSHELRTEAAARGFEKSKCYSSMSTASAVSDIYREILGQTDQQSSPTEAGR